MSQEVISSVQEILKGILNPDNNLRNQAAEKLEEMRKNTGLLITCLVKILHGKISILIIYFLTNSRFFR